MYEATKPLQEPRLQRLFDKYGPVPRTIYLAYFSPEEMVSYDSDVTSALNKMSLDTLRTLTLLTPNNPPPDASHKIICVWRSENQYPAGHHARVLSRHITEMLYQSSAFQTLRQKRELCTLFAGIPNAGVARG